MTLTRAQMDRKIDEHFGFERRDDVEAVLATLTPDVEHDVVGWPTGPVSGAPAAKNFYEQLMAAFVNEEMAPVRTLYGDDSA